MKSSNPSERAYQRYLPEVEHLPPTHHKKWLYYKLFPNVAFDIYPDQVDFMQFLPVSATETVIREISYALPDNRREMKAVRYLELAHQPAGKRRGHRTDYSRPARNAEPELCRGAAGDERGCACAPSRKSSAVSFPRHGWNGLRRRAGRAGIRAHQPPNRDPGG